jgi:drug/metabolite transporter (DMT)-like permease
MSPTLAMVLATLLFASMGVCVKLASELYSAAEIVMYRGVVGVLVMTGVARVRGESWRTPYPAMHFWRSAVGVTALALWFYAIGGLPLATGMTLNYMSSIWMAVLLVGGSMVTGAQRVDSRLIATVMVGFGGVAMVLQPTLGAEAWAPSLAGLASGLFSALAYLQVAALARVGEPDSRIVYYFSWGSVLVGGLIALFDGFHPHSLKGAGWLLATGVLATLAQMMLTRAYAAGKPLVNATLAYLGIVFSVLYAHFLFGDELGATALGGMLLIIVAGVAASLLRARQLPTTRDVSAGGE